MDGEDSQDRTAEQPDGTGADAPAPSTPGVTEGDVSALRSQIASLEQKLDERTKQQSGEVKKNQSLTEQVDELRGTVAELGDQLKQRDQRATEAENRAAAIKAFTDAGLPTEGLDLDTLSRGTAEESAAAVRRQVEYIQGVSKKAGEQKRSEDLQKTARQPDSGGQDTNGTLSYDQYMAMDQASRISWMAAHPDEYQALVAQRQKDRYPSVA